MYKRFGKRALDILFSAFFLIILSPLFLLIMLLICLDTNGCPFFKQERIGLNEKVFIAGKFGTIGINKEWRLKCA